MQFVRALVCVIVHFCKLELFYYMRAIKYIESMGVRITHSFISLFVH